MTDEPEPTENLHSLQDELAELVKRSLAQRAQADEIGVRMKDVATKVSKMMNLTPPPEKPS
jgi:hypothetical protein